MLSIEIHENGNFKVVAVGEDITHENVVDFQKTIDGLIEGGCTDIILDLSEVPYITSKGLGAIVASYTVLKKLGGNLIIVCPQEDVARSFSMTRIDRILDVVMSEQEAVNLLQDQIAEAAAPKEEG